MTTQKEMRKINMLRDIIVREGSIGKIQLIMKSSISISYYEKLKPFLEEIYAHQVRYFKETKTWHVIKQEEVLE